MSKLDRLINKHGLAQILEMPTPLARAVFGEAPVNDLGAPLDYQTHMFLQVKEKVEPTELPEMPLAKAREVYDDFTYSLSPDARVAASKDVRIQTRAGTLHASVHRPGPGNLPALVFFHGGGFVVGSAAGYDPICRYVAAKSGCVVINVDYRLAPEHPFPCGIEDAIDAFLWVHKHADELNIDRNRIAVGGDSAGAKLSTVCCQQLLLADQPLPAFQMLLYPTTRHGVKSESSRLFAKGYFLTGYTMDWFGDTYLAGYDHDEDIRVSPFYFERKGELPPMLMMTGGFDPLRDAGDEYAELCAAAGCDVIHRREDTQIHGFWTMGGAIKVARKATDDAIAILRRRLAANL